MARVIQQSEKEQQEFDTEIQAVQDLIDEDAQIQQRITEAKRTNLIEANKVESLQTSITANGGDKKSPL